ncbi:MAG TPA: hypothetical protein PLB48_13785, partial [Treponema sp.]|nr:hypothetical protein [Treponema sp.]
ARSFPIPLAPPVMRATLFRSVVILIYVTIDNHLKITRLLRFLQKSVAFARTSYIYGCSFKTPVQFSGFAMGSLRYVQIRGFLSLVISSSKLLQYKI